MDPFEKLLTQLVEHMMVAWQLEENRESPLGELCAEAAAVLQFYREARLSPQGSSRAIPPHHEAIELQPGGKLTKGYHWSDPWRHEHGK